MDVVLEGVAELRARLKVGAEQQGTEGVTACHGGLTLATAVVLAAVDLKHASAHERHQ